MESPSFADRCTPLVGTRWREGGRELATGIDCMGAVLHGLWLNGIAAVDPWLELSRAWGEGWRPSVEEVGAAFGSGWHVILGGSPFNVGRVLATGMNRVIDGVSLVVGPGLALTALPETGTVIVPTNRLRDAVLSVLEWVGP